MTVIEADHATAFVRASFQPQDWICVLVKNRSTGRVGQRIVPVDLAIGNRLRPWLDREQRDGCDIYVTVNALRTGATSRRRSDVAQIRHVFLDADQRSGDVLDAIAASNLPPVSYVMHTSPDRAHIFWRVDGFTVVQAESVQGWLAHQFHTDRAATRSCQLTRWPGSLNQKRRPAHRITIAFGKRADVWSPANFPSPPANSRVGSSGSTPLARGPDRVTRARRYVSAAPPAIAGRHGDHYTFVICCRVVRGFGLSDDEAMDALCDWNQRCEPPWSEHELRIKLRNARRYGHEPVGGRLNAGRTSALELASAAEAWGNERH